MHRICLIVAWLSLLLWASTSHAQNEVGYVVFEGEHLIGIANARLVDGASTENLRILRERNKLKNPHRLAPGQILRLPIDRLRTINEPVRVVDAHGEVALDGKTLLPGTILAPGQRVRTGVGSGVVLELADGSRIWVREQSEVSLQQSITAPGLNYNNTEIEVPAGRIQAIVQKAKGTTRFRVRTPNAVLGVRGTDFRAGSEIDTAIARLEVLDGRVEAASTTTSTAALPIDGGFGTVVKPNSAPLPPQRLLAAPNITALGTLQERPVVRFSLPALEGAASYRGEIAEPTTTRIIATNVFRSGEVSFPGLPDGRYVLAVRGIDREGLEGLTATHAFNLKARPEPPLPTVPTDRTTLRGESVNLTWTSIANARYRIQIAASEQFTAPVVDQRDLAEAGRNVPLAPGQYYWRLATIDATGDQGPFSVVRRFELRPTPPTPAANPPKIDPDRVQLAWQGDAGQTFDVQLARDATFSTPLRALKTTQPEVTFDQLEPGRYFVRIRATESDGYVGQFSPPQSFDVPAPPVPWWIYLIPLVPLMFL